jgi:HD-like signal output (HDOD) protein
MLDTKVIDIKLKIKNQLSAVGNLPTIPHIITEVSQMLDNENTSASDLCKVISQDQSIATKILAVANSPMYGIPRRVATIDFAIVIIGLEHIRSLLLALTMMEMFKAKNGADWNHNNYWKHSLMVGTTAKKIATDLRYPKSGEVFTAGLLHDLGLLVIQKYMQRDFKKILELVKTEDITHLHAERMVLGFTHGDIAEYLFEKWNFPSFISEAVSFHHIPSMSQKNPVLASLIHLVDYITQKYDVGSFEWDKNYQFDDNVVDILGFGSMDNLEKFLLSYEELFKTHFESLN